MCFLLKRCFPPSLCHKQIVWALYKHTSSSPFVILNYGFTHQSRPTGNEKRPTRLDCTPRPDAEGESHFPDSKQCANWTEMLANDPMTRCRWTVAADLSAWTSKLSILNSNKIPKLLLDRVLLDCGSPVPETSSGWLELRDKVVTRVEVASQRLRWRRPWGPVVFYLSNYPLWTPEEHLNKVEHKYHLSEI